MICMFVILNPPRADEGSGDAGTPEQAQRPPPRQILRRCTPQIDYVNIANDGFDGVTLTPSDHV